MKLLIHILIIAALGLCLISCDKDDNPPVPPVPVETEQTLFMYLPWASNLLPYFEKNIKDMETAVAQNILKNEKVLVFFHTSESEATLFELVYDKDNGCIRNTFKSYVNPPFTTAEGITSILNDVINHAPAKRYAMAINCHGMAWVPKSSSQLRSTGEKEYWENDDALLTRWFGGTTLEFQTDITTLAQGIKGAGIAMEYILFDDCYMSSIEVGFDLKEVTDHLIASPCEIMAHGMPYDQIIPHMLGEVDYEAICKAFHTFYENYELMPCGTIGVINCRELDNLATVMKEINTKHTFDPKLLNSIQRLDGYNPVRFFDYGDYVSKLCTDSELFKKFEAQLDRTVPPECRLHTEYYYSMSGGKIKINSYSGVTISDPSVSSYTSAKTETAWYKATH